MLRVTQPDDYTPVLKHGPAGVRTGAEVVFGTLPTIGAARDYLGGARSITPPPLPLPGPTSKQSR